MDTTSITGLGDKFLHNLLKHFLRLVGSCTPRMRVFQLESRLKPCCPRQQQGQRFSSWGITTAQFENLWCKGLLPYSKWSGFRSVVWLTILAGVLVSPACWMILCGWINWSFCKKKNSTDTAICIFLVNWDAEKIYSLDNLGLVTISALPI